MGVQVPLSAPQIIKKLDENGRRTDRQPFSFWTLFWTLSFVEPRWTLLDLSRPRGHGMPISCNRVPEMPGTRIRCKLALYNESTPCPRAGVAAVFSPSSAPSWRAPALVAISGTAVIPTTESYATAPYNVGIPLSYRWRDGPSFSVAGYPGAP